MDDALFACVRLAAAGYGTVEQIMQQRCDYVVAMLDYERFKGDFDRAVFHLNKSQDDKSPR